jgi:hypothetical protein
MLRPMSAVDELIEALTEAGLKWGRPPSFGAPEIRVKADSGREYAVRVLRFSFMVAPQSEASTVYQRLTVADVVNMVGERDGVSR